MITIEKNQLISGMPVYNSLLGIKYKMNRFTKLCNPIVISSMFDSGSPSVCPRKNQMCFWAVRKIRMMYDVPINLGIMKNTVNFRNHGRYFLVDIIYDCKEWKHRLQMGTTVFLNGSHGRCAIHMPK